MFNLLDDVNHEEKVLHLKPPLVDATVDGEQNSKQHQQIV